MFKILYKKVLFLAGNLFYESTPENYTNCIQCGLELTGSQRKFCSTPCNNRYYRESNKNNHNYTVRREEKKMNKKINYLAIMAIVFGLLFVVTLGHDFYESDKSVIPEGYVSSDELQDAINENSLKITEDKDSIIASLTEQLANKVIEIEEKVEKVIKESLGHIIDNIFIGEVLNEKLSDREVKTLFDGKVSFGDEEIDAEEVIELYGKILTNGEDFNGVPYFVLKDGDIVYKSIFDDDLNISEIDDDENILEFNFLGKEVRGVEWNDDSVILFEGEVYYLDEGVVQTINGYEVELVIANDDSALIRVGDNSRSIGETNTKTIGELQVKVEYVFETTNFRTGQAKVTIGDDLEKEIFNNDEFEEDSIWEYLIDGKSRTIGLILSEEFKDLDDDYKPLASKESLCLPNDYVCVRYDGFVEEDTEELSFELDDGFVEVRGDFQSGLNDYKKVLVNSTGIYNDDEEVLTIVTIGSSDVKLELAGLGIRIEDFEVNLDLNVTNVAEEDYNVRTDFGIVVEDTEKAIEDNEWTIVVPYEQLESKVIII